MAKNQITLIPENAQMLRTKKYDGLLEHIVDDNNTPDKIRIQQGKSRYELHDPKNPNNPDEVSGFVGVVLFANQAWVLPRDAKPGDKKKEKRVLQVLRWDNGLEKTDANYIKGRIYPEQFWVPTSGIPNFAKLCKDAQENYHVPVFAVLVHFDCELARNKDGDTWGKPVFRIVRALTEDELEYTEPLTKKLVEFGARFQQQEVDTTYEENAFGTTIKKDAPKDAEDEIADKQQEKARKREIEDGDGEGGEDDAKAKSTKKAADAKGADKGKGAKAAPATDKKKAKEPDPEPDEEDAATEDEESEEEETDTKAKDKGKGAKPTTDKKPAKQPDPEPDEDEESEDDEEDEDEEE